MSTQTNAVDGITKSRRRVLAGIGGLAAAVALSAGTVWSTAALAETPSRITVDYAYYNPVSLLLKKKGWLEEAFEAEGTKVRWVLSLGSNKALEYLAGSSVDFDRFCG